MARCARHRIVMGMKLSTLSALLVPALSLVSSVAEAAPNLDLQVTLAAPSVHVYEQGTYTFQVGNVGNRHATGVQLVIDLPATSTTPIKLMGTLGPRDPRCTLTTNRRLTCALATINRNTSTTVAVALALPYSVGPLAISATATSSGTIPEATPSNNSLAHTAQLATYPTSVAGGAAETRVCSGTSLTSFFECELFPSSIQGFTGNLAANGSVTIDGEPTISGAWWLVGNDTLHVEYVDGATIYTLDAKSIGGDCYEGRMNFGNGWVALHEMCIVP